MQDVRSVTAEQRDSVRVEKVMVAVHDTIMETTTITVDRNDTGDTLRLTTVTDRERVRNRDAIAVEKTKTEIVRDTVFVAVRDSVNVSQTLRQAQGEPGRKSGVVLTLKWVFWIIVALAGLIIVIWVAFRLKF